jgi:hypothetical protein
MLAKRFFYVTAGLLCLALAYHLGATSATAQAPGNPCVAFAINSGNGEKWAATANGDTYYFSALGPVSKGPNLFGVLPTPAQQSTFGAVKARYR